MAATNQKHSLLRAIIVNYEVIIQGKFGIFFLNKFQTIATRFSQLIAFQGTIKASPRPIFENIGIIAALIWLLIKGESALSSDFAQLSVIGIFAYRMYPHLMTAFNCIGDLSFYYTPFKILYQEVNSSSGNQEVAHSGKLTYSRIKSDTLIAVKCLELNYNIAMAANQQREKVLHFDYEFPNKKVVGIVGQSGLGKSTLIRALAGLHEPRKGSITYNTSAIERTDTPLIRYVGPEPDFFNLGVYDNVALIDVANARVSDRNRVLYCLEQVGLTKSEIQEIIATNSDSSLLSGLSSGQRQKIAVARALYDDPDILLLDEATANFDKRGQEVLFENLVELSTLSNVILVTHDTRPLRYCDEIVQISNVLNDRF